MIPSQTTLDRLEQCRWPPLADPYDAALREATAFIFDTVDPLAVIATGTIVRGEGEAHASSDLDLYVLVADPSRRRIQRFFRGVPAEIFINPPHAVRGYFEDEHEDGRRYTAHMIATGVVVWSNGPVVDELRAEARDWLGRARVLSESEIVRARYGAATWLEDGADVAGADPATSAMLLTKAVVAMVELLCKQRDGRLPRPKDLLSTATIHDPKVGELAREFFASTSPADRLRHAEEIADRTIGVRGFFEWDSGPQPMPRRS